MTLQEGIPDFLRREKPLTFSYSFLNCYDDICPYQAYRTYIVRDIPYVETPERKAGNKAHEALALRVGGKPLPEHMQEYEPFAAPLDRHPAKAEGKIAITRTGQPTGYFDKNVWFRGAIDVAIIRDTTGFIFDWKLVKNTRWTKRFELDVHALLLHAKHPHLRTIKAQYVFLNQKETSDVFDCSDTRGTWQVINDLVAKIESDLATKSFEKRSGPLCKWCGVFDCDKNQNPERPSK